MGIYGIQQYHYYQNNYRMNEIPPVDAVSPVQEVKEQDNIRILIPEAEESGVESSQRKVVDPNEISIGINKNNDYSFIGRDKDIQNLDMKKAISEMRQDTILKDYTYFVGNSRSIYQSDDGVVLLK